MTVRDSAPRNSRTTPSSGEIQRTKVSPRERGDWSHHTRTLSLIVTYAFWSWFFRLLTLTWITQSLRGENARLQDISESYFLNELVFTGFGAILYFILLRALNPIRHSSLADFLTEHRLEKSFLPGFLKGSLGAFAILALLTATGFLQVIGFYLDWAESPVGVLGFLLRSLSLIGLVYTEEFLFRHRILGHLRREWGDLAAIISTSVIFVTIKNLQFDLGLFQTLCLFIFSLILCRKTVLKGEFAEGAGLLSGLLFVLHPLASLPVFGNDYQGIFLIKSQVLEGIEPTAARWISGGAGGPFASLAFLLWATFEAVHQENFNLTSRLQKLISLRKSA